MFRRTSRCARPANISAACTCWLALTCMTASASAAITTFPLPELEGIFSFDGHASDRMTEVDLRGHFNRIDKVQVRITGTVAPGLFRGYNMFDPDKTLFDRRKLPSLGIDLYGVDGARGTAALNPPGAFDLELPLDVVSFFGFRQPALGDQPDDWDFLLDGSGSLRLVLVPWMFPEGEMMFPIVYPLASISSVALVVEGVPVPEPGAAFLSLPLILALLRRTGHSTAT